MESQRKRPATVETCVGHVAPHRIRVTVFSYPRDQVSLLELNKADFDAGTACFNILVHTKTSKENWPLLARWLFQGSTFPANVELLATVPMSHGRQSLQWDAAAQIVML